MKLRKVYRYRMRPTKTQEVGLYRMAGARRFVYNWALSRRKDHYAEHGKGISARELSSELTALKSKPETLWLKEADSQMLQQLSETWIGHTMRSSRGVAASPGCAPRRLDTSPSVSPSASESRTAGYTSRR